MENEKKFSKKNLFTLIGLVIVIIAIVLAIIFSVNSSVNFNDTENISESYLIAHPREDKPIVYIKNGGLYVKNANGNGDATELSLNLCSSEVLKNASIYTGLVTHAKTSNALYFIKDYSDTEYTGTLCITTDYKTTSELDTNVAYEIDDNGGNRKIALSDNGKTVVYMKNIQKTNDQLYADLYYKNIESAPIVIADFLQGFSTQYIISPNGEYIAAYSDYDKYKNTGGFYILKNGEQAKNIVPENENSIYLNGITNDGKLIYSSIITDASGNKIKECVTFINYETMERKAFGENVDRGNIFFSDKSDKIVYIEKNETAFSAYQASFDNEAVLITDKYYGFTSLDVENECYSFAAASGDETYAANKKIYLKTPALKEASLLCEKILLPSDVKYSADYEYIYFLSEDVLYFTEISEGNFTEKEKIAENVKDFKVSQGGNSVVFTSNYNEETKTSDLNAYTRKDKKVLNVASGITLDQYTLSVDGLSVVYSDGLSNEPKDVFNAKLSKYNLYGRNKNTVINDKASMMFYYYDQYLASSSEDPVFARNKYNVRSSDSVLYFTEIGTDCVSGKLNLYSNGKTTLVDENVMTVLFE